MRIQVLTQEDAFYIPRILDLLLERRRDIVGVHRRRITIKDADRLSKEVRF